MRIAKLIFNCCKNPDCSNFARAHSRFYHYPSYQLGYPALHCESCDSYPPLCDETSIQEVLSAQFAQQRIANRICDCSEQYWFDPKIKLQRYGKTSAGRIRLRCPRCNKVACPPKTDFDKLWPVLKDLVARTNSFVSCNPKLYYQRLSQLHIALESFSRHQEAERISKLKQWEIFTQGQVLDLGSRRSLYVLLTCDVQSGYSLLFQHNCIANNELASPMQQNAKSTIIKTRKLASALDQIKDRYSQIFQRQHFEDLNYAADKSLRASMLVTPTSLAYAHFQIVNRISHRVKTLRHYLQHDSCLRGAALMGHSKRIKQRNLELYYFLELENPEDSLSKEGSSVGWWSDRWYPDAIGALCPISLDHELSSPPAQISQNAKYFAYLQDTLTLGNTSLKILNQRLDILRIIYNFCHQDASGTTSAMRFGLSSSPLSPMELLQACCSKIDY